MAEKIEMGLGRLPSEDERDEAFPLSAVVRPSEEVPKVPSHKYWWPSGWWGDQGATPQCVAYSWLHLLEDGPITHAPRAAGAGPVYPPGTLYKEAQRVDEWPGENYAGTSVRAGAKILQARGLLSEYRWAWDLATTLDALRQRGPVVIGTWWYESMFYPDADGLLNISGRRRGGHAYLLNGVNVDRGIVRLKNSWGRGWGRGGHAYLRLEDLARLISEQGEVCMPVEVAK